MLNSLDSISHVVASLQQKYKSSKITPEPIIINDLSIMTLGLEPSDNNQNKLYFGVLNRSNTISTDMGFNGVMLHDGILLHGVIDSGEYDEFIVLDIEPNSQIIALFEGLLIMDSINSVGDLANYGTFRGFEITISPK